MPSVLAVDDQKVMREMVRITLEQQGHQVTTAEDGVEAMQLVRQQTFDLVITDINMPNMNGISFVSKLKKLDSYQFTPVLMLTTETSGYKKEKARNFGASGWLTKPFEPERLVRAVSKLLARAN
jgi:two-component system chemotaxis response regulator CheY